jgi:hypothetical protein
VTQDISPFGPRPRRTRRTRSPGRPGALGRAAAVLAVLGLALTTWALGNSDGVVRPGEVAPSATVPATLPGPERDGG